MEGAGGGAYFSLRVRISNAIRGHGCVVAVDGSPCLALQRRGLAAALRELSDVCSSRHWQRFLLQHGALAGPGETVFAVALPLFAAQCLGVAASAVFSPAQWQGESARLLRELAPAPVQPVQPAALPVAGVVVIEDDADDEGMGLVMVAVPGAAADADVAVVAAAASSPYDGLSLDDLATTLQPRARIS